MEAAARAPKQQRSPGSSCLGPLVGGRRTVPHVLWLTGAFTLIELMVVVILIGIVTALILPDMRGTFEDVLLRATGRSLVSAFGLASSQAITVNQAHRVRLDLSGGQFVVERVAPQRKEMPGTRAVDGLPGSTGKLDKRIRIQIHKGADPDAEAPEDRSGRSNLVPAQRGDKDAITFYPDGTAEEAEIRLQDRDGFGLALRINATTSRVRIQEVARP